jgi:Domain of unknown function (DUF4389)
LGIPELSLSFAVEDVVHAPASQFQSARSYPVYVYLDEALVDRNRLTTFFRPVLAIPHLLLVGGPASVAAWWAWGTEPGRHDWGASGGLLGAVAFVCAVFAWFAILFTGRQPEGLRKLAAFYFRWRVRSNAYVTLLRDEYPPFGDWTYPVMVDLEPPATPRNRPSVAFRALLVLPHLIVLALLGVAWFVVTLVAWISILFTGRYPEPLYGFSVGMLRWNARVDAYVLLLIDDYPAFSLEA